MDEILRWLIFHNGKVFKDGAGLALKSIVELMIFGLVMARTPVMKVAVDAMLNFDVQHKIYLIKLLDPL